MLEPLRDFEISLICRYLPAKLKLEELARLNSTWHHYIFKNYFWTKFPQFKLISSGPRLLKKFSTLAGISIPNIEAYIEPGNEGLLSTARDFSCSQFEFK